MSEQDLPGTRERAPIWTLLIETAAKVPDAPALRHKLRGVWVERRWRDVVDEVDRLAAGLRSLGVEAGGRVAVEGEITARLLLVSVAARTIGAEIVPIAPDATDDVRIAAGGGLSLALVQGRAATAAWVGLNDHGRTIPVVFDHATAHGESPFPGVTTIGQLRALVAPKGWARELPVQAVTGNSPETLWVEESTQWTAGLNIVIDRWLSSGNTLALPELLAAAARDRGEIAPNHWIASPAAIEAAALAIEERFPLERSWSGRLVRSALTAPDRLAFRPIISRLRRHLGLAGLAGIELPDGGVPLARSRHLLTSLGVQLAGLDEAEEAIAPHRDTTAPSRSQLIAGAEESL